MIKRKFLTILLLCLGAVSAFSQSENYGTWIGISGEKKFNKWDVSAETELRTIYFLRLIDRWSIGAALDYSILKQLKIGVGYQLMNSLDYDADYMKDYFIRNRLHASAIGKLKWNDFSFSLRQRIQVTFKEERMQTDGTVDDYKMNPAWAWRNRLQVEYNIPNCKITPSASIETFYDLNNPDGNSFENIRSVLSLDYKLNKKNHVELYGVINSELQSDDADGKYILGLSYKHTF